MTCFRLARFIKAADIGDHEVVVTIDKVEIEEVGDEQKAVAYFIGKERGLVLNRTNWDRISLAAGTDETDEWPGLKIMLFTEPVTFNGKTSPAIRVRAMKKKATPTPSDDDFGPNTMPPV